MFHVCKVKTNWEGGGLEGGREESISTNRSINNKKN